MVQATQPPRMEGLIGLKLRQWLKLLWDNRFAVSRRYVRRTLQLTIFAMRTSFYWRRERKLLGSRLNRVEVPPPTFVLGHWQSGTTLVARQASRTANGRRQKIDAYASLKIGNLKNFLTAIWLFGGVGLGFKFPKYAMDQFEKKQPWDTQWSLRGMLGFEEISGGHYVPAIGYRGGNIMCVTWGKVQMMTPRFYLRYADECVVYLDLNRLHRVKRLSPEGFDEKQLRADLLALARGRVYAHKPPDTQIA